MIIPKNKSKRRKMFIELNYLDKTSFEAARNLINSGDIGSVILGIETLMQSPRTTSMKKAFNNNFALEDFHDSLIDEGYVEDYN
jgi:hypothetical protein